MPLTRERALLWTILAVALALRVWFLNNGVPHAVGIDEPAVVDRALRILATGDWNPHVFDYPTLTIYVHAFAAAARFLLGAMQGEWASLAEFDIAAVYRTGRALSAVIGTATVWLTYRIGRDLRSAPLGLVAAAQLAVLPMHVRESHFILTDVPVTALTTLTVWLSMRAAVKRDVAAYAVAGAAAGLAAAAKYNGAVAIVAVIAAWALHEWSADGAGRKLSGALLGAAAAFLVAAPFTLLDLPAFLNGFAAQAARFSPNRHLPEPAWLLYLKHLGLSSRLWLPAAAAGAIVLGLRASARVRWAPAVLFALAYFYVLATHPLVFGRYALPLLPVLCLLSAGLVVEVASAVTRTRPGRAGASTIVLVAGSLVLTTSFAVQSVGWLKSMKRRDTRQIAAEWMRENVAAGARIAVENSGPTYMGAGGFAVRGVEMLSDHPVDWYIRDRIEYLIVTSADRDRMAPFLGAGQIVFEIAPTPQRWGPPVRIVRLGS